MAKRGDNGEFKIEKGVPLKGRRREGGKYPFPNMEVGDSFEVRGHDAEIVRRAAYGYGKHHGMKFATRQQSGSDHIRVWRIE